jgi:hypothetical protein
MPTFPRSSDATILDVMEVKLEPAFDSSGSDDRSSSSSHTPNPNLLKKRGKYVQKACDHCKKKHVKCVRNSQKKSLVRF